MAVSVRELIAAVAEHSGGRLQATIVGPDDIKLSGVAPLSTANKSDLAFLANPIYRKDVLTTRAGAVVLTAADQSAVSGESKIAAAMVLSDQPYAWFAYAAQVLNPAPAVEPGVANGASVAANARIDRSARVEAGATVGEQAAIGARAWIGAGAVVGARATIGDDVRLYSRAVVLDDCRIGQRSIVHSGAVIGGDGFGFAPLDGKWIKIPQVGAVVIGDDVEVGANTTIDRGAMGDTIIESGAKLDSQIQIAHNCVIGAHTVIAGCVGIAGSTKIGRNCRIGGAAMIGGHLTIADGTDIGPASAVNKSIAEAGHYTGFFPLMKHREWERAAVLVRTLDELRNRVRQLESEHATTEPDRGQSR